jgi:peptidylprolyl isomerase
VDDAYGPKNQDMLIEMPKDRFPKDMEIEPGIPLMMSDGSGHNFQVIVAEVKEDAVVLDANHPLAGERFDILTLNW